VGVRSLTLRTPTLDDVFLEVTGARLRDGDGTSAAAASKSAGSTAPLADPPPASRAAGHAGRGDGAS
jgi:hypothetical protein